MHFTVQYTAGIPKITLLAGDPGWVLYAREVASPSTPASIGEITLDPNVANAGFGLKIQNGSNPGAT